MSLQYIASQANQRATQILTDEANMFTNTLTDLARTQPPWIRAILKSYAPQIKAELEAGRTSADNQNRIAKAIIDKLIDNATKEL